MIAEDLDLNRLVIGTPCDVPWDSMPGTDARRHCDRCRRSVHNFAELSREQIRELIDKGAGDVCGHLFRRPDGTIVTGDCRDATAMALRQSARRRWGQFSMSTLVMLVGGCAGVFASMPVVGPPIRDWLVARFAPSPSVPVTNNYPGGVALLGDIVCEFPPVEDSIDDPIESVSNGSL